MNKRTSKIVIFDGFWTIEDVNRYPHALFVYGDNDVGFGKGGQAIIRGLKNTVGIPTKKYPTNDSTSFYTDNEYKLNIQKINYAIDKIKRMSKSYKYVVLPKDGFGTGLAHLPQCAPKTYAYLVSAVDNLKELI